MTDEERKEAERLADAVGLTEYDSRVGTFIGRDAFIRGYAACAKLKRTEIDRNEVTSANRGQLLVAALKDIEAERVRSAKLLSSLEVYGHLETLAELNEVRINAGSQVARKAIAEYEAGRD